MINKEIAEKLKKIKVLLTDVDGVLTDGGMYYTEEGLTFKKFNVKDGMGSFLLRDNNFKVGIITSDPAGIGKMRAERLRFNYNLNGVIDKKSALLELCKNDNYDLSEIAFIGDDINDLEILGIVGLSVCPADAHKYVLDKVDYVSTLKGGEGIFRELADMILEANNIYADKYKGFK